jgi:hypothetical protein
MRRAWRTALGGVIAMTVVCDLLWRPSGHAAFWWHATPAFDVLLGLAGCLGIVLVSKWLGRVWLERQEVYYGAEEP